MAMVILVRGTKSSRLSRESRGRRDEAEVGSRMASRRYLGATPGHPHLGLEHLHTSIHACMHTCMHAFMHPCIHASMHPSIHPLTLQNSSNSLPQSLIHLL